MVLRSVGPRLLALTLLAVLATTTSPARAEPSLSDRETARSLMDDGDAKRDKGDVKAALKSYEAADAIMHVPTTGLEVARTQAQLGLLLEARETLGRVLRTPPRPGEPAPFTAARRTAESLSSELGGRIPSVTLVVTGGEPGRTSIVLFDGEVVPPAAVQAPRKVNPGHHVVIARSGALEKRQEIDVAERDAKTVSLDLRPVMAAPKATTEEPKPSPSEGSALPKVLVYGGFGIGAVGIGIGTVTGLMSISKTSDVKKDCVNDVCPPARQGDLDSAKSLGTVSTIAFLAGGVGVGVGIIGLVLQAKQPAAEPTAGTSSKLKIRPNIGPTWAGLSGSF